MPADGSERADAPGNTNPVLLDPVLLLLLLQVTWRMSPVRSCLYWLPSRVAEHLVVAAAAAAAGDVEDVSSEELPDYLFSRVAEPRVVAAAAAAAVLQVTWRT
jgi:hypothetical protein